MIKKSLISKLTREAKPLVKRNKNLMVNFFYVTILQVFLLVAPLITYPYLVKILGMDLYGLVISAQILASYASIIIDFGSNNVCAKHISLYRSSKDKLSEIVSSVLLIRCALWFICLIFYVIVVYLVPEYRKALLLFLLTYGLTLNEVLFPQFFFQGIEKMKYTTIVNIIIKLIFIGLLFLLVRRSEDYLWIPILYTVGYILGGGFALWIIFKQMKIKFIIPHKKQWIIYLKDSLPLLATDLVCTIKDKFNYILLGLYSGMSNVVVYDLGMKIYGLTSKPSSIVSTVMFPKSAKDRNVNSFNKIIVGILGLNILIISIVNIFLPTIVSLFLQEPIDLMSIRLFTLAPLFSTTGAFIISNLCVAYGYNTYALYSIIITTIGYIILLIVFYFTHFLSHLYAFVLLAVISYFIEFVYRVIVYFKIVKKEKLRNKIKN